MTGDTQAPRSPDEVREFFATWIGSGNRGDFAGLAELMHPDVVLRDPMTPEPAQGHAAVLQRVRAQYEPFPDGQLEMIGDAFVSLDEPELAYRWRFTGTHLRPIHPPGFAATGRRVELEGTSVLRFQDRLVVDVRLFFDTTDAARQLLAAPPAGGPLERVVVFIQRLRARASRRSAMRPTSGGTGRRSDHRAFTREGRGASGTTHAVERRHPPTALMKVLNPVMCALLRRDVGRLGERLMILRLTGRRSGTRYEIPVGQHELDGQLLTITDSGWRVNLRGGQDVELVRHGETRRAHAELVEDPETVAAAYRRLIERIGHQKAGRQLGITLNVDRMPTHDEMLDAVRRYGLSLVRYSDPAA